MGLFASIIKAGIRVKSEDKEFHDMTDVVIPEIPKNGYKNIKINSCLDVKVFFRENDLRIKMYLADKKISKDIRVKSMLDCEQLRLNVEMNIENVKGYIAVYLPKMKMVQINTKYSDIEIEDIICDELIVNTGDGDVKVSLSSLRNSEISTKSGSVLAILKEEKFSFVANSKNGDIILEGIKSRKNAENFLKCITQTGDIIIKAKK